MEQLVLSIINGIVFSVFLYLTGILLYDKPRVNIKRVIVATIIYVLSFVINIYNFSQLFTIFFFYTSIVIFHKIIFQQSLTETLLGALMIYFSRLLIEIILVFLDLVYPEVIYAVNSLPFEKLFSNTCSAVVALLVFSAFRKYFLRFVNKIKDHHNKGVIVLSIIYFCLTMIFIVRIQYLGRDLNLISDIIIILLLSSIAIAVINQEDKMAMMSRMYNEIANYAKLNDKLIDEYRITIHERRNELIVIDNMLKGNKKEAQKYVKELINEKESLTSEWLNELNNIPILGMRGFINFKIIEMKHNNIKPEILISPDIKNIKKLTFENVKDLYTIVGVLLDNAIEASCESEEKMTSIQMYEEKNKIHLVIANSFLKRVNLDKINTLGYTTKGNGRGTGLVIVNNIIKSSNVYKLETKIFKNFFVQDLTISI